MAESSLNRLETLWEKEELLVTSNFSFSNSVFKKHVCAGWSWSTLSANLFHDRERQDKS